MFILKLYSLPFVLYSFFHMFLNRTDFALLILLLISFLSSSFFQCSSDIQFACYLLLKHGRQTLRPNLLHGRKTLLIIIILNNNNNNKAIPQETQFNMVYLTLFYFLTDVSRDILKVCSKVGTWAISPRKTFWLLSVYEEWTVHRCPRDVPDRELSM